MKNLSNSFWNFVQTNGTSRYTPFVISSVQIIYASSSGHTEYVIDSLVDYLAKKAKDISIEVKRAEEAQADDLTKGDVLILACGTWNTGGVEGQLNMHMDALLRERAKDVSLAKKPCAIIALGDDRYYYTGRATEHLMQFVIQHDGVTPFTPLLVINEPYGQEEKIQKWGDKFLESLK